MSTKREHEKKGIYVCVIRTDHGWYDGSVSGYLIDDNGTIEIDSDPDSETPYTLQCSHRRDYEICEKRMDYKNKFEKEDNKFTYNPKKLKKLK